MICLVAAGNAMDLLDRVAQELGDAGGSPHSCNWAWPPELNPGRLDSVQSSS
jgi:hypothetical protein